MAKLRFRDGEREVLDHLVLRMSKMNVRTMTYDQALAAVNRSELADYANNFQRRFIADHFKDHSRG